MVITLILTSLRMTLLFLLLIAVWVNHRKKYPKMVHRIGLAIGPVSSGARCGQRNPTDKEKNETGQKVAEWVQQNHGNGRRLVNSYLISTYVHNICDAGGNGCATKKMIDDQMAVLNAAFAVTGFSFNLTGQTQTNNTQWYTVTYGSQNERNMKEALH